MRILAQWKSANMSGVLKRALGAAFLGAMVFLLGITASGCRTSQGQHSTSEKPHPAEVAAEQLVSAFSVQELADSMPNITVFERFSGRERRERQELVRRYVVSQSWVLCLTEIVVLDRVEDVANCFFKGSAGGYLELGLVFHEGAWIVTRLEIPTLPGARGSETFETYIERMMAGAREQGVPYRAGLLGDGLYLLEH